MKTDEMRVMVLGGGSSQEAFLRRCKEAGWWVILVDQNPNAPGRRFADQFVEVSTFDPEGVEVAARRLHPDCLATVGSDQPVRTAAVVSRRLGLPYPLAPETAERTTNKRQMKVALYHNGIPTVAFEFLGPGEGGTLSYPKVIKPLDSQGQRGISLVGDPSTVHAAVSHALRYSQCGEVLAEEYYPSEEVTLSGWVEGGHLSVWAMTDRIRVAPEISLGVCVAHRYPSIYEEADGAAVRSLAAKVVPAIGVENGPVYMQFLIGREGIVVNEVACRLGGAYEDESLPLIADIDPIREQMELCARLVSSRTSVRWLGESVTPARRGASAKVAPALVSGRREGVFCVPLLFCEAGTISSYEGWEEAAGLPGVVSCRNLLPVGTEIRSMENSTQRVGYAVLHGSSRETVNRSVEELFAHLRVVEPSGKNILMDTRGLCRFPDGMASMWGRP